MFHSAGVFQCGLSADSNVNQPVGKYGVTFQNAFGALPVACSQCNIAIVCQIGTLITTGAFGIGTVVAILFVIGLLYLLFRPYKESKTLKTSVKGTAKAM